MTTEQPMDVFILPIRVMLVIATLVIATVILTMSRTPSARPHTSTIVLFSIFLFLMGLSQGMDLFIDFEIEAPFRHVFLVSETIMATLASAFLVRLYFVLAKLTPRSEMERVMADLSNEISHHKWTRELLEIKTKELVEAERKRAKAEVANSVRKCGEVLSQLHGLAAFEVDMDGNISSWNATCERLFGYTEKEAVNQPTAILHRDQMSVGNAVIVNGQRSVEGWRYRKDGSRFWALITSKEVVPFECLDLGIGGKNEGVTNLVVVRDMSDRMNISKELARESQRLRSVLNTIGEGVIIVNAKGDIQRWNKGAENIFGYRGPEVQGHNISKLLPTDQLELIGNDISALFTKPKVLNLAGEADVWAIRRSGERFPVELASVHFTFEGEDFYTIVIRDITDRRITEQSLKMAKDTAEEASHAKSRFLAGISHELRTPLTIISGYTDLIEGRAGDEQYVRSRLGFIKRHCKLLLTIINDLLDLSKAEAGKLNIHNEDFELSDLLRQIGEMFRVLTADHQVLLEFVGLGVDENKACWVKSDSVRIRQVLSNLLSNAVKFSNTGGTVRVTYSWRQEGDTCHVIVDVEDQGVGIPEDRVELLFQPFSQIESRSKRELGGTGLGLVLSRRLARMLGGDVTLVRTEVGVGSTFRAEFMVEISEKISISSKEKVVERGVNRQTLLGHTILVVDDTDEIRTLTSELLKYYGANIVVAEHGARAIEVYQNGQDHIDLILMDIRMPVMDGWEARSELAKMGCQAPIVALTANAMADEIQEILLAGFDGYLSKPINPMQMVQRIASLIAQNEGLDASYSI